LDFYQTKRQAAKAKGPKEDLNVDEFYEELSKQFITSTTINDFWRDWRRISQIDRNGKVQRITEIANEIEKIANWIGTEIGPAVKKQTFLESMHDILRAQVEPLITERKKEIGQRLRHLQKITIQYSINVNDTNRQAKAMKTDSQRQQQWNDQGLTINATKQGQQIPIRKGGAPKNEAGCETKDDVFFAKQQDTL
jgi:hypothetical protein